MLEFKAGMSGSKIRAAVVAFSNTDGGVVLIGVEDDGNVIGVPSAGEAERHLWDLLDGIHNSGRLHIRHVEVDGRTVLVLGVRRRREGFSQLHDGAVLVRRGARNESLIGPDLTRFQRHRSFERFEDAPSPATTSDADPALATRAAAAYGFDADHLELALIERGLAERTDGVTTLTVAGALILVKDPGRLLGRCGIELLRYRGNEPEPDKRTIIEGAVDSVVRSATQLVMDELGVQSVLVGVQRVDLPRLPEIAVRETIANAVAHRSYEANGTHIKVQIREDSLTVTSPGSLPEPVTIESMRSQQAARNPKVLEYLRRTGLAEDLGLGIDRIEDSMQRELLERPTFDEVGASLAVSLAMRGVVTPEERGWVRSLMSDRQLDPSGILVVLAAMRHGSVTNSAVRAVLKVDSTEARVVLQHLANEGILVQSGTHGGTSYSPAPLVGHHTSPKSTLDKQADAIAAAAFQQEITNADVRDILGVDRHEALRLLNWMVDRGSLERSGTGKGSTYRPARR